MADRSQRHGRCHSRMARSMARKISPWSRHRFQTVSVRGVPPRGPAGPAGGSISSTHVGWPTPQAGARRGGESPPVARALSPPLARLQAAGDGTCNGIAHGPRSLGGEGSAVEICEGCRGISRTYGDLALTRQGVPRAPRRSRHRGSRTRAPVGGRRVFSQLIWSNA